MMKPRVEEMKVLERPYAERYPEMRTVRPYLSKAGGVPPEGNTIRRNIIDGPGLAIRDAAKPFVLDVGENVTVEDASFFTPATGAYRAPAGMKFEAIPVEQIGLRRRGR